MTDEALKELHDWADYQKAGSPHARTTLKLIRTFAALTARLAEVEAERDKWQSEVGAAREDRDVWALRAIDAEGERDQLENEVIPTLEGERDRYLAERDKAISGLARYGHCDADCTRQNFKGLCSCGFCRFSDEGGLFSKPSSPIFAPREPVACPQCGSHQIEWIMPVSRPDCYRCWTCGLDFDEPAHYQRVKGPS